MLRNLAAAQQPVAVGVGRGQQRRSVAQLARRQHAIAIGVIATPAHAAQEVADCMVQAGVSSILNFAWIESASRGLDQVQSGMRRNLLRSLSLDAFAGQLASR